MLGSVTKKYQDESTLEVFRFTFFCDCCGKALHASEWKFGEEFPPKLILSTSEQKARQIIWAKDHEAAFERANREILGKLNRCESCGARICDDCARVCEAMGGSVVCKTCAAEKGLEVHEL